jgi:hypothetical protein
MVAEQHIGARFIAEVFGPSTEQAVFICSLVNNGDRDGRGADERFVTTRDLGDIAGFAGKWDVPKRGCYYCVATLAPNARRRAKDTLAELNCLHADIDFKDLAAAPEEVRRVLCVAMRPPSAVIATGHGLHCLWLFKEALAATPETIAEVERLLRRLAELFGANAQAAECARLLRLPGSHNTKHGEWTEVAIESCEPTRRYELDDLRDWLDLLPQPLLQRRPAERGNGRAADRAFVAFGSEGGKPPIDAEARIAAMRFQGPGDSAIHATQLAVSASLLAHGVPVEAAVTTLLAATRTAAGEHGARWNWEREERDLRRMCTDWLRKHPELAPPVAAVAGEGASIPLHPYAARPFGEIPPRRWLHASHYIRGQVVMTVAPGGYGKTSLVLANVIEMCAHVGLLGALPIEGPLRVAYWNAEDPEEEVERRIAAVCLRHGVSAAALAGYLHLGSRVTGSRRIAQLDRAGNVALDLPLLAAVQAYLADNHIDVAMFDPLIAFHRVPEGDNNAMVQVVEAFGRIAESTDCCIELSQHTRKSQGAPGELTADDSRGASAIVYAARSVRVLNRMTPSEAELPKIEPEERRHYLRVARDKTNLAPPGKATWVHLTSVDLPNGDKVQAAEPWTYPEACEGVTAEDAAWAHAEAGRKAYRTTPKSPDWFGYALADHLCLGIGVHGTPRDARERGNRKRVTAILRDWLERGVLARERRRDEGARKEFEFFGPGKITDSSEDEA